MSVRLTVSDLQASRISAALNVCPDDERFYQWLNEAENLMLGQGRWWGSIAEARFCVRDCMLTWPREVANVEQINVCGQNVDTQGGWYNFVRFLPVTMCGASPTWAGVNANVSSGRCGTGSGAYCTPGLAQHVMRDGTAASFATTRGANKVIRTYPTHLADVGKTIIYQGRDSNGIWVRTVYDGDMRDGEKVTLALPFVDTATTWGPGAPVATSKDVTAMRVLVYEYDTVTTLERALADYQAGETRPTYRVSRLPGLGARGCCASSTDDTDAARITVTALVSLQHVELRAPGDWLVLQNLSAYKAAMMAVKAWEEGDAARGDFYFYGTAGPSSNGRGVLRVVNRGGALPLLKAEQRKMTGDRTAIYVYADETERYARTMLGFR